MRSSGLTYSKFARQAGIGMQMARDMYEDPYYSLTTATLLKCAEFFNVNPEELLESESTEDEESKATAVPTAGKKKLRQRVGELIRQHNLTYSKFARKSGISMGTARALYEDPYHNLTGSTLLRCAEFFKVESRELVVEEDEEVPTKDAIAPVKAQAPQESELLDKFLALIFPESLLSQARQIAGKNLVGFLGEALAEKVEREFSNNVHQSSENCTISEQIMVRL